MGETAILNLVATPPPTPAQSAQPSPTPTPGAGDGRAFATELDRQLKVLRPTHPGLGSDAGKGREAGESSSAAAAGEKDSEQGQSADPGRASGTDRLALVAQLFAALAGDASAGGTNDPSAEGGNGPVLTASAASGMVTGALTGAPVTAGVSVVVGPVAARANAETVGAPGAQSAGVAPGTAAVLSGEGAPTASVALPRQATAEAGAAPLTRAADETAARGAAVLTPAVAGAGLDAAPKGTEATAGGAPRPAPVAAGAGAAAVTVGTLPGNADAAVAGAMMTPATEAHGEVVGSGALGIGANEGNLEPAKVEEPAERARIPATTERGQETAPLTRQSAPAVGILTPGGQPAHPQATPQAAPQAAPAHVPAQSVIDQLLAGAKMLRRGPVTELQVQLKPESLGRVDLKVSMENGALSARILVDNPGVKAALEANLPQLKQSLADQGIALQGMTVGYGGERGQSQGDAQQGLYRQEVRPEPHGAARQLAPQDVAGAAPRRSGSHHRLDLIM